MVYFLFLFIFGIQFFSPLLPDLSDHVLTLSFLSPAMFLSLAVLMFVLSKVFGINLRNPRELRASAGYLIIPAVLLVASNFFYTSIPGDFSSGPFALKLFFGLFISALIAASAAALKEHQGFDIARYNFLYFAMIVGYFLGLYGLTNFYWAFPGPVSFLVLVAGTYLLSSAVFFELFWLRGRDKSTMKAYISTLSFLASELVLASAFWMTRYRFFLTDTSRGEPILGVPVAAILVVILVAYLSWGLIYHKLTSSLTRRVAYEYIAVAAVFVLFVLLTNKLTF